MKGKLSRMLRSGLSLMLVFCMLISMAPAAFAVEVKDGNENGKIDYVSIGDSMANGYGFVGYEQGNNPHDSGTYDFIEDENVYGAGAYPLQFEDYLTEQGYDVNHTKLAPSGLLAEDLIWLLDDNVAEINDGWAGFKDYVNDYEEPANIAKLKNHFRSAITDADIITMGIGNASFGAFMMDRVAGALGVFGASLDGEPELNFEKAIAGLNMDEEQYYLVMAMYENMRAKLDTNNSSMAFVSQDKMERIVDIVAYTAASYIVHYKMVIKKIIEMNPDVEIILVGLLNTTYGMNIVDENGDVLVAFGDMMDENFAMLNAYMAALPAILQAQGKAGEAEFYFAEQPNPKFICQEFEYLQANNWESRDPRLNGITVRDRNITSFNDNLGKMIGEAVTPTKTRLAEITLADVEAYEDIDWEKLEAYGINPWGAFLTPFNSKGTPYLTEADDYAGVILSVAIYLAIEESVAKSTSTMDIPQSSLEKIAGDMSSVFTGLGAPPTESPEATRLWLVEGFKGEETQGMCKIYGLFKVGNGMSVHPTPAGHDDIIVAVKNAYANGDPEKSNTVAKEYVEILKGMSDDASLAMEIYNYLGANDKITDKQTVVIMHAAMGLNEEVGDDTMALLKLCYATIMDVDNYYISDLSYEDRLEIIGGIYDILERNGKLEAYKDKLPLLKAIVNMDSLQNVSAKTRFEIVDGLFNDIMNGNQIDTKAVLMDCYDTIMHKEGLEYADRLAIIVELYNILKGENPEEGYLADYADKLPLLEAIVTMDSLQKVSEKTRFEIFDGIAKPILEGKEIDAKNILMDCYDTIMHKEGLEYAERLAIIVELYNVLKEQGMLADYEADLSVLEEILALPELEAVSAEKKFDLVDTIFNLVMSSEGDLTTPDIRQLIGYIWFTTLDVGGAEEQTVFARFAARIAGSELSVEEKINIVGAVLAVLNDGTAQIDAIETLFNDLTALDEENDQYVPDDVLNELFDKIMEKVADPSVDLTDSAVTTALAADMATTILTDNRIKTENRPYIVEAIAKALAAIGGEDVVGDVAGEDAEEALEVIVALRDALEAAGYLSDAQQGEILEEVGAILPEAMAGDLSQEQLLAIANNVYNIVYNRDDLSTEQKLAILNIIYGVLEDYGYVSKEDATNPENIKIALEELYKLMEQYGPTAAEQVWKIWEKYGYVDLVNASVAELKAVLEARYAYYTETALPAIDASIAALNAQKANLEADLAVLKAELEAVLAEQEIGSVHTPDINLDVEIGNNEQTIVPDHECESDGTIEGEKAAAIADLEHAIAVLEALIADIDADIADMTALAEQIAANVVELGKTISDLVAAGEDVAAAVAAISAVLASDNGADAYYAACATAKAALEVLEVANAAANELAADVDVLMDMLLADAQALNKLIADTQNDILAELAQDEVIMQGVGASLIMYKLVMDNQDVIQLIAEQEIAKLQAEADAKLAPLMEELSGLEAELAALEAELEAKLPELEAKQAELEEAIKAEAEEAVKAALEAELAALQGEIEKIEAAKATVQAQIERVKNDMATIKADLEHAIGHLMNAATAEMLNQLNSALNDLAKILAEKGLEAVNDIIDAIIELVKPLIVEATTEDYVITKDSYYVALGDGSAVSNSYVDRVAGELGIPFANLSVDGQTLANAPAYIEANAAEIAKADLITLGYGNNAFAKKAIDRAYAAMSGKTYESYDWTVMVGADGAAYVAQALADIKVELVANGMDTAFGKTTLADATVLAMEAYAYHAMEYVMNLPAAIAAVREVNPNAVVLIVGMYNPLEDSTLAFGESAIAVGEYLDYLVTGADVYGIAYCILFDNANYVSAPDAETEAANREHNLIGFLTEYMVAGDEVMNPNAEGHEYIKTKILNALNITVKPGTFYKKFMQGFDANTFRPQNNITRAQAAKMFANILDESYKANYKFAGKFSDIPENFWAAKELEILSDMGVILGFEDGTFRPNAPITRGQFAAMAVRFVDATIEGTENFSDIDQNTWCYDYVRTAVANGWIDGYADGTYRPQGKITRAAAAKIACGMLDRPMDEAFFDAQVEAGAMKALDDTVGTWAYYWILSATNSFVY